MDNNTIKLHVKEALSNKCNISNSNKLDINNNYELQYIISNYINKNYYKFIPTLTENDLNLLQPQIDSYVTNYLNNNLDTVINIIINYFMEYINNNN